MKELITASVTGSVSVAGSSAEFVELRVRRFSVSVKDFVTVAVTVSVTVGGAVTVMWSVLVCADCGKNTADCTKLRQFKLRDQQQSP